MSNTDLVFKKNNVTEEVNLKKIESLGKRASDKEYGAKIKPKNDKSIPFYTDKDTYIKLQQCVLSAKLNGTDDETSISKILRKGLTLFFEKKDQDINDKK